MTSPICTKLGYKRTLALIELFEQGVSYEEIADLLSLGSKATVSRVLRRLGRVVIRLELYPSTKTFLRDEQSKLPKNDKPAGALVLAFRQSKRTDGDEHPLEDRKEIRA